MRKEIRWPKKREIIVKHTHDYFFLTLYYSVIIYLLQKQNREKKLFSLENLAIKILNRA